MKPGIEHHHYLTSSHLRYQNNCTVLVTYSNSIIVRPIIPSSPRSGHATYSNSIIVGPSAAGGVTGPAAPSYLNHQGRIVTLLHYFTTKDGYRRERLNHQIATRCCWLRRNLSFPADFIRLQFAFADTGELMNDNTLALITTGKINCKNQGKRLVLINSQSRQDDVYNFSENLTGYIILIITIAIWRNKTAYCRSM